MIGFTMKNYPTRKLAIISLNAGDVASIEEVCIKICLQIAGLQMTKAKDINYSRNRTYMKHLWEIQHPYGCGDTHKHYTSWDNFLEEFRDWDADDDYNFVVRWDWRSVGPKFDHLDIIFLQQRRVLILKCTIQVTLEEESDVISYLKNRLEYMKKMWEPLL